MKQRRFSRMVAACLTASLLMSCIPAAAWANSPDAAAQVPEGVSALMGTPGRQEVSFNEDWKFQMGDVAGGEGAGLDDSDWRTVTLPHDFSIEQDFANTGNYANVGFLPGGVGWYRKSFTLPPEMAGKRISISFGGVYMDSNTYVNGKLVGNYPYGYSPFAYDITDDVVCDGVTENVIAVRVDNPLPSSRWYSGTGIYRDVELIVTQPVHVARYGTYVTTPDLEAQYAQGQAQVQVETTVENDGDETVEAVVSSTIYDANGNVFAETVSTQTQTVEPGAPMVFEQSIQSGKPQLWSVDSPNLYTLETQVTVDGAVTDTYETTFGFRWFDMDPNEGFSLNGEYMKLNGVCMHHDQGALGAVANDRAIERQMEIMKSMGVNAIRVTHNPADDELLAVCNRLGLLVIDEAFDCWETGKTANDYGRFFSKPATHPDAKEGQTWAEFDIKNMVNRGKNEPCIIMWSLGNEVNINGQSVAVATNLNRWVKEVDETRPTTQGFNNFIGSFSNSTAKQVADVSDVAGFNYGESGNNPSYDQAHQEYPDWIILGSETSSAVRSRGYYKNDDQLHIRSCYDDSGTVGWGSSMEHAWQMNRDRKWVLGEFMWTGFDYNGEPSPYNSWPSKSSYFGAVDTAGIPKDAYYMYQSVWTSVEENPMVHLMPHWNWEGDAGYDIRDSEGKIRVQAYTNAPVVELFLNGESLGKQTFDQLTTDYGMDYQEINGHIYAQWKVPYEPGELKAVAYDAEGNEIATDIIRTSGQPAQLRLTPDREVITADGQDLSYFLVEVLDKDGNLVPTADNLINFQISGNGTIVGVDNGNATASDQRYKDNKRTAYSGKAMVIVQSNKSEGPITITASSVGLQSASKTVFSVKDTSEKKLLGYDTLPEILTTLGQMPQLPETVTAIYSDGSREDKTVEWNAIDESLLQTPGMFQAIGTVSGTDTNVWVNIVVKDILGVRQTRIVTPTGVVPQLPETVTAVYNNGETQDLAVEWERALTQEDVAQPGTVTIQGTAQGLETQAVIQVMDAQITYTKNIALRNGQYPIPTASFEQANGNDPVTGINDGNMPHQGGSSSSRWIPWNHNQKSEWCQLELEQPQTIGRVGIHLWMNLTDGLMDLADTLIIQYSLDGESWTELGRKTKAEMEEADYLNHEIVVDFSQSPVEVKYVRCVLENEDGKSTGVSELCLYAAEYQMPVSHEAKLDGIQLDGVPLEGFDPDVTYYTVSLPYGAPVPEVTAQGKDGATVFIIPALSPEKATAIEVTGQDGQTTQTYQIQFAPAAPALDEVTLAVEGDVVENQSEPLMLTATLQDGTQLKPGDYTVTYRVDNEFLAQVRDGVLYPYHPGTVQVQAEVTYEGVTVSSNALAVDIQPTAQEQVVESYAAVNVITEKGVAPQLPTTIQAQFVGGFSKPVAVTWDEVDPQDYAQYGAFQVSGHVEGQTLQPVATVTVRGVAGVQTLSTAVPPRFLPEFPEKVNLYYSDGTVDALPVTWDICAPEDFETVGDVVTVSGHVEGLNGVTTTMTVRVTDQVEEGTLFTEYKNGFYLPLPFASYTNDNSYASDKIDHIYDGVISYNNDPVNRWSNWRTEARTETEYVGMVFGYEQVTTRSVDNLDIFFFEDSGVSVPASYEIQYYTGPELGLTDVPKYPTPELDPEHALAQEENWTPVTGLQAPETLTGNAKNSFTFDAVYTCAIRIKMTPQEGKSLGMTEFQIHHKLAQVSTQANLTDISLNGTPLEGFSPDVMSYTVEVSEIPTVTATADNNAAVTVVSPVYRAGEENPVAKITVTAEDGLTQKEYEIQFRLVEAPADKTLLQKTYDYALTLSTEGVTDAAKEAFEAALEGAKAVLGKADATQDEVNAAWDALLEGIWGLGLTQGDKTMLNLLIDRADTMMTQADQYVEANWKQLVDALTAAKAVSDDGNAMQEDVDQAAQALLDAILAQRYKADKSILEDLINQAQGMDLNGYTAQSVEVFRAALAEAQVVLADESLSKDEQKTVDAAVDTLAAAMDGLTAEGQPEPSDKPEVTDKPEATDKPEVTDKPEATEQPEATDQPQTTPAPGEDDVPATGDSALLLPWAGALALSCAAALWVVRRKERT